MISRRGFLGLLAATLAVGVGVAWSDEYEWYGQLESIDYVNKVAVFNWTRVRAGEAPPRLWTMEQEEFLLGRTADNWREWRRVDNGLP